MKRYTATVDHTEYVGPDTIIIHFAVGRKSEFRYIAGQYITIFFAGSSTPAGKAYSLSSSPHERLCSITVKKVGEFSSKLYAMKRGDKFEMSEAYGHFNPHTTLPIVALSAGVGIAPVWSVVKQHLHDDADRVAHLFYSNVSPKAIAHHTVLDSYAAHYTGLHIHHHITRSPQVPKGMTKGRIDLDACLKAAEGEVAYLVCGSVEFVRDMWRGLVERGVAQELINTEIFFE